MKSNRDRQGDIYSSLLEQLVSEEHVYRKVESTLPISSLVKPLEELYARTGKPGEPICRGFKCLLLQYWEDLSDRQLERYLRENLAAKWFCGYGLQEPTPDHSYFGKLRKRIGAQKLCELFNRAVELLESAGYVGNVFHFVDASSLLSRVNIWEARDKAITDEGNEEKDDDGNPKMNNSNVHKYSSDPDARFGCKGNKNFWFGYKRHLRVDMRQGMIAKVALTDASVPDHTAFVQESLAPTDGMVFMDKGYDCDDVYEELRRRKVASGVIMKRNRKQKNYDLDRWRSKTRMPFEGTFSKMPKLTRYRTKIKVKFETIFQALVHNCKRLITIRDELAPT